MSAKVGRAQRMYERAVRRFSIEGAKLVNGDKSLPIEIYKARPSFIDDGGYGVHSIATVLFTCSSATFQSMKDFIGGDGWIGGKIITVGNDRFVIDKLTPFTEGSFGAGFVITTQKLGAYDSE